MGGTRSFRLSVFTILERSGMHFHSSFDSKCFDFKLVSEQCLQNNALFCNATKGYFEIIYSHLERGMFVNLV